MQYYRKELKYFINQIDCASLKNKLSGIFNKDEHGGGYAVRSLYFDNKSNNNYYHKIAGISDRNKYRIRIYDLSADPVKLEIKSKKGSYIKKMSVNMKPGDAKCLIEGDFSPLYTYGNRTANKVLAEFSKDSYKPVIIIDYFRDAYFFNPGNIRVTFDSRLAKNETSLGSFFHKDLATDQVIGSKKIIMEIKFDHHFPRWIKRLLQVERFESCAISKYTLSRFIEG